MRISERLHRGKDSWAEPLTFFQCRRREDSVVTDCLILILILAICSIVRGENIIFPPDAGIVDVKARYGAKSDGVTDDTAAIQAAIDEVKGIPDTLYFPNGTYLISDSVGIFNGKAHSRDRFLTYQGQSETGTVIRLKDNCPGFDDPNNPKILFSVYEGQSTGDVMHSYVRNLTIDVGSGNPGAVGLRFMSNNSGSMDHVTIRSSDPQGRGKIGLDMRQSQNGPDFIKNVTIIGFDHGVETGNTFSLVFEHITLKNQNKLGFYNHTARTTIRDLKSTNSVPVLRSDNHAHLTLIEGDFTGGDPANTAIFSDVPKTFLRDIRQSGYGHTVKASDGKTIDSPSIEEWYEGKGFSLFGCPLKSLRLPIKETPEVPWETDLTKWVKVDWSKKGEDIGQALQDAIDRAAGENKTTIYIPRRTSTYEYPKFGRPIRVHGSVNRIIGMSNIIDITDPSGKFDSGEQAIFTFEELTSPAVVVERFFLLGGWKGPRNAYMFENKSGKALVLKNLGMSGLTKKPTRGGECYIEDVPNPGLFIGPGEKCWARQYNPESPEANMVEVDGGQLWILGLKTEGRARHVVAKNGAKVELLGGVSYQSWKNQPLDPPMFTVVDSEVSFTFGFYHWNQPFSTIVEETSQGETRTLKREDLTNYHLPLYRACGASGEMTKDSPVTFPKQGALPARYSPDVKVQSEPAEQGYYIFSSPCRSIAQIARIQSEMPKGKFTPPPSDWTYLPRTRRILTEGGELRILATGDSIVNDMMRSGWVVKLRQAYPKAEIKATVYVRGGGGCQHYKENGRIAKYVVPHKPDLVLIGGISQRSIDDIRVVVHQLRAALPKVEIILATGAFGTVDPRDAKALAKAPHSGTGAYGRLLKKLATEEHCAYLDMTAPWAEYIRSSKIHPHRFYRDVVHANEYGEQILSRILISFFDSGNRQTFR